MIDLDKYKRFDPQDYDIVYKYFKSGILDIYTIYNKYVVDANFKSKQIEIYEEGFLTDSDAIGYLVLNSQINDSSTNYIYVEPNSQFFTTLEQMLEYNRLFINSDDFKRTIENTIKRGYKIVKE